MRPVDAETRQYFSQINKTLQDGFENEEENEIFVSNVLDQLKGRELQLCTDSRCSRVIEQVIHRANHNQIVEFLSSLESMTLKGKEESNDENNWLQLFFHCNGCHIIQSIIERVPFLIHQQKKKSKLESIILNLSNQLFDPFPRSQNEYQEEEEQEEKKEENEEDNLYSSILYSCLTDRYANHVLKALMMTLRGISTPSKKEGKHKPIDIGNLSILDLPKYGVPSSFDKILLKILEAFTKFDLNNLIFDSFANTVIQIAIEIAPTSEDKEQIVNRALCFDNDDPAVYDTHIQSILSDNLAMRFLEKIFRSGTANLWTRLYNNYLKKKMSFYAVHPVANFAVRACIDGTTTDSQLKMITDELFPLFDDIFQKRKLGIFQSLAESCARLQTKQKEIIRSFTKLAQNQNQDIVQFILYFKSDKISSFGSQILQSIFKFSPDARQSTLESFHKLDIKSLCNDYAGSRLIEEYFGTETIDHKTKQKMVKQLKGQFAELAQDKFGSHVLEKIYEMSSLEKKAVIAEELAKSEQALAKSTYGRFILRKCGVEKYQRQKEEWSKRETSVPNKRKLFADILEDDDDSFPKKSKNK